MNAILTYCHFQIFQLRHIFKGFTTYVYIQFCPALWQQAMSTHLVSQHLYTDLPSSTASVSLFIVFILLLAN